MVVAGRLFRVAILITVCATDAAWAEGTRIQGTVRATDGTPLPGAVVTIFGTSLTATTDQAGRYELTLDPPRKRVTIVAALGRYNPVRQEIGVDTPSLTVDFTLKPVFSAEVTVEAEVPLLNTTDDVSRIQLAPAQIAVLPSLGERDIFRAFQLLPGVSGSNEASSGLFVRGSTPDQNFISYDGFRVYHVDHLFGYFSAFNMDAVENVVLSKGGFEAKYGGTLSSVLEITGKTGSLEKRGGRVGASLLSVHGAAEAPIGEQASILVAARRSFQGPLYDKILNLFDNSPAGPTGASAGGRLGGRLGTFDTQPSSAFYDVNGKLLWRPSSADAVSAAFYKGGDNLDNSRSLSLPTRLIDLLIARGVDLEARGIDPNSPTLDIQDVRDSGSTGAGLVWSRYWNNHIQSRVSLGYSQFDDIRERSTQVGRNSNPSDEDNRLRDVTLKASLPMTFGRHVLESGVELTSNDVSFSLRSAGARPAAGGSAPLASVLDEAGDGRLTALFAQDRWMIGSKLLLVPGIRITRFDRTDEQYTDPRLALTVFVSPSFKLKAAAGRYHQFTSRITRENVLTGNREFWSLADGDAVPVSEATHQIVGAVYQDGDFLVNVEAFKKDLSALTQFAPRLATAAEAVDYRQYFYHGDSTSRGVEILLQKKSGSHTGWLSYTLGHVEDSFPALEAEPFPSDRDQRHELKLVNVVKLGNWRLSGTWILATGKPYTEPSGLQPVELPFGGTLDRVVAGPKNQGRLPAYHRLDIALHRELTWSGDRKLSMGVTAFNLYNRKNVWYKEFNVVEGEISENNIRLIGFTLNAFIEVSF